MNKKGSVLLLFALLAGLPGCGPEKDTAPKKMKDKKGMPTKGMPRRMAQADEFTDMSMPLAEADTDMIDDDLKSFFNDDEFMAFNDDEMTEDQSLWDDSFETVYFGFGEKGIDQDQWDKLEHNAEQARQLLAEAQQDDPNAKLIIEGHACSSAGTDDYNQAISEARAQAVAEQLIAQGISADSIEVEHYGSTKLILKDGDRDEQWVNRRVQFRVA